MFPLSVQCYVQYDAMVVVLYGVLVEVAQVVLEGTTMKVKLRHCRVSAGDRAGKVRFGSVQSLFFLNLNLNLLLQGRTEPEPELNLPELVLLGSELVQNWFRTGSNLNLKYILM